MIQTLNTPPMTGAKKIAAAVKSNPANPFPRINAASAVRFVASLMARATARNWGTRDTPTRAMGASSWV
jgi:hypothetical protein